MNYLFLHPVFPGQFHKLIEFLSSSRENQVVHISQTRAIAEIPGVKRFRYTIDNNGCNAHPFAQKIETSSLHGLAASKIALAIRNQGFIPDIIYGYAGWGPAFFMKDIFPATPLVGYAEWYMNAFGSEYNFDPENPLALDKQMCLRTANSGMLLDLNNCDYFITPTNWQKNQFPAHYHKKISVIHDGVDTQFYSPGMPDSRIALRLGIAQGCRIVTYATRGMEPFRGFPQFMRALALVQKADTGCHAIIAGTDEIFYSKNPGEFKSYKDKMLKELEGDLDLSRIHFTGWLSLEEYRDILRLSHAHVYMTYPYVLSWSCLEAMSTGAIVIGSSTSPVKEVIRHGENGFLIDFFDHKELAETISTVLSAPDGQWDKIRKKARTTIIEKYDYKKLVPRHAYLLNQMARREFLR